HHGRIEVLLKQALLPRGRLRRRRRPRNRDQRLVGGLHGRHRFARRQLHSLLLLRCSDWVLVRGVDVGVGVGFGFGGVRRVISSPRRAAPRTTFELIVHSRLLVFVFVWRFIGIEPINHHDV